MGEMVDINDELVRSVVTVDDGRDYTARLVWKMGNRRDMRNGISVPIPPAPKVSAVRVEAKRKPRKRGYRVVQKAIHPEFGGFELRKDSKEIIEETKA